ncbi:hypothetical protein GCM10022215_38380 [Nocardioides fonticola]|uniref:Conjugal transfer protein n=1 Tax=Nocardioides fonticola TaxID=450363 RepID=A0ABP7XYM3_9ACTN
MSMERSRRARFANTAPSTGEFAIGFVLVGVFVFLITPLAVQGLVGWATSGSFAWPNGHLASAYGGLLRGRFGAGLTDVVAAGLPGNAVMWVLAVIGEVLAIGATVVVAMWMRDVIGANSRHGLATATQAAEALGLTPLRKRADQIRPDLYARTNRNGLLR